MDFARDTWVGKKRTKGLARKGELQQFPKLLGKGTGNFLGTWQLFGNCGANDSLGTLGKRRSELPKTEHTPRLSTHNLNSTPQTNDFEHKTKQHENRPRRHPARFCFPDGNTLASPLELQLRPQASVQASQAKKRRRSQRPGPLPQGTRGPEML